MGKEGPEAKVKERELRGEGWGRICSTQKNWRMGLGR